MDEKPLETINIVMTPDDVALLTLMLESTLNLMLLTHANTKILEQFQERVKPFINQVIEKVENKVLTIAQEDAIKGLKINFTDKNSPKDKTND